MFLHSYINPSSTKKLPLVDTLISVTRQLDFDQFLFYYKNRSGVGLYINFRHWSSAILLLWGYDNLPCQVGVCHFNNCHKTRWLLARLVLYYKI